MFAHLYMYIVYIYDFEIYIHRLHAFSGCHVWMDGGVKWCLLPTFKHIDWCRRFHLYLSRIFSLYFIFITNHMERNDFRYRFGKLPSASLIINASPPSVKLCKRCLSNHIIFILCDNFKTSMHYVSAAHNQFMYARHYAPSHDKVHSSHSGNYLSAQWWWNIPNYLISNILHILLCVALLCFNYFLISFMLK